MEAAVDPFDSIPVPDDILKAILLQLPSSASLVRAAFVSKHWGRIISSSDFLTRYRKLYPSSPLLGIFSSDRPFGLPAFRVKASIRSDRDLKAVQRRADLLLTDLKDDSGWRIRDSRNGHLLLCRRPKKSVGDSFSIYNPLSHRLVTIPQDRPDHQVGYFADCLLLGDADGNSFRVVSVQQHNGRIRAVEYDPGACQWNSHPWQSPWGVDGPRKLRTWCLEPMRAGTGLIFWHYNDALAIVLDCSSMQFSTCHVPPKSCYAIGEIKDGVGCIVCLDDTADPTTHGILKVGLLNTETKTWEFSEEQQIPVTKLLGPDARVRLVDLVTNGLALISWDDRYDKFVIDLKNLTLHAEFDFRGRAYPYQMAWPPVGLPSLQNICKEEAQPVQLVLPVQSAPPLQDVDVAAPVDDVGLAAPLEDVDFVTGIGDVAYTEGPLDVGLRPLDLCATEHVMDAEADNLVGPVEDGVRLIETKAAETVVPSDDLVEGMTHSSEAISRKPRREEVMQSVGDVPPEQKDQGPKILCDSDVNVDVLELVKLGEAHMQLTMDFYSKAKANLAATGAHMQLAMDIYSKAKAKLAATSALKDVMVERPNSSVPPEVTCKEEAQPMQLVLPVESAPPLDHIDASAPIDDVGLAAPLNYVDLAAWINDVASTEGPLDVGMRLLDLSTTEHVMAAEADSFVGTVKDGVILMETKAVETAVPSADLIEAGMTHSSEDISRKQICEEEAQHLAAAVDDVDLAAPIDDVDLAAQNDNVAYTEGPLDVVLRPLDLCSTEHVMAAEADNLVGTFKDGMPLMETKAVETTAPSADFVEGKSHSSEAISREQICEEEVPLECQPETLSLLQMSTAQMNLDAPVNHAANRTDAVANEVLRSQEPCTVEQFKASKAKKLVKTADHVSDQGNAEDSVAVGRPKRKRRLPGWLADHVGDQANAEEEAEDSLAMGKRKRRLPGWLADHVMGRNYAL